MKLEDKMRAFAEENAPEALRMARVLEDIAVVPRAAFPGSTIDIAIPNNGVIDFFVYDVDKDAITQFKYQVGVGQGTTIGSFMKETAYFDETETRVIEL